MIDIFNSHKLNHKRMVKRRQVRYSTCEFDEDNGVVDGTEMQYRFVIIDNSKLKRPRFTSDFNDFDISALLFARLSGMAVIREQAVVAEDLWCYVASRAI